MIEKGISEIINHSLQTINTRNRLQVPFFSPNNFPQLDKFPRAKTFPETLSFLGIRAKSRKGSVTTIQSVLDRESRCVEESKLDSRLWLRVAAITRASLSQQTCAQRLESARFSLSLTES